MQRAVTLYSTTIGKKAVMAVSGAILFGFTVGHLAGNLNLYRGREAFNGYAETLASMPPLVWGTRFVLLGMVTLHILSAFLLWSRNKNARPTRYAKKKNIAEGYATLTMYTSGPILLFYILFHLAHLTFGQTFGIYEWIEGDPYNNLVNGFRQPLISALYIVGNLALGFHLFHGIFSMFQSVGANHPKYNQFRRDLAVALSALITLGNISIPVSVLTNIVTPTVGADVVQVDGE